ncbi:hypothetical protein KXD40_009298 [Peronospora effusa]|nr:hypothetical protein KXD40_009298 [Peronospora effusa]
MVEGFAGGVDCLSSANGKKVIPEPMNDFDNMTRELVCKANANERRMLPKEAAKERDRFA